VVRSRQNIENLRRPVVGMVMRSSLENSFFFFRRFSSLSFMRSFASFSRSLFILKKLIFYIKYVL